MSSDQSRADCDRIFHEWHEHARSRNIDALLNLYAEDAILESPWVPLMLGVEKGVLKGHAEIRRFLEEGARHKQNELVRWHRTGTYLSDGKTLVWEYPRETPEGEQLDILEFMEIESGKIKRHIIFWGWLGLNMVLRSAMAKAGAKK